MNSPCHRRLGKLFVFARIADQVHVGTYRNVLPVEHFRGLDGGIDWAKHR